MTTVAGQYVKTFAEASHVLFDGHLDDPGFRGIAIQRILKVLPGQIIVNIKDNSHLPIHKSRKTGSEFVWLEYKSTYNQIFGGTTKTKGHPFKDRNTPVGAAGVL